MSRRCASLLWSCGVLVEWVIVFSMCRCTLQPLQPTKVMKRGDVEECEVPIACSYMFASITSSNFCLCPATFADDV
jgi:hypothetical protein